MDERRELSLLADGESFFVGGLDRVFDEGESLFGLDGVGGLERRFDEEGLIVNWLIGWQVRWIARRDV